MKNKTLNICITAKDVEDYNLWFLDDNSIHSLSGDVFQKLGCVIVNGAYILSLVNAFVGRNFSDGIKIHSQDIKYVSPTYSGEKLTIQFHVEDRGLFKLVTYEGWTRNEKNFHGNLIVVES